MSDGKQVKFIFKNKNNKPHEHSIILYDFNIDSHHFLKNYDCKTYPATYRDFNSEIYSHMILEITTKKRDE